jgi:DNA polymerase III epsilon subunit-like protein
MSYLFLDVETGGIGSEYSLLTSYFLATDNDFNKVSDLYLYLKPDDGVYKVCGPAMGVNKIDLYKHDLHAIPYKTGATQLYNWLRDLTKDGQIKLNVVGHNVGGDRDRIVQYLISRGSWEKFTSYRLRDTQSISGYLKDCQLIPEDVSGSLESLIKYFGIEIDVNALHDAKYDTEKTLAVFLKLTKMLKDMVNREGLYSGN